MSKKKIGISNEEDFSEFAGAQAAGQPVAPDRSADAAQTEGQAPPLSEAEEWKDKCLRARAELLNFQRRSEKDRSDALRYANAGLVKSLLPVLDDLERVIESTSADEGGHLLEGVRLTRDNFTKVLQEAHVETISAAGQPFDPRIHEALMQQPSADHPPGTVLQEVARGYKLYDRVLRPAKVIVSKEAS